MGVTLGTYGSIGADGWTTVTESVDTTKTYVSDSGGNDTTGDGTIGNPYKTITKVMTVLNARTNGIPYWILLKCGDTFTDQIIGQVKVSGRSATEPLLFTSYGSGARPLIKTTTADHAIRTFGGGGGGSGGNFCVFIGLEFYQYTRDPGNPSYAGVPIDDLAGVSFLNNFQFLLFEDCKFSFFADNFTFSPPVASGLIIRRCVITDAYNAAGQHSQGMFVSGISSYTIEENVVDHNGWNASITGADRTIFNHGCYLANDATGTVVVRGNILARSSSHGAKVQSGGATTDNLCLENAIGLITSAFIAGPNPCRFNVILQATDITVSLPRGFGIDAVNTNTAGDTHFASVGTIPIEDNVIAHVESVSAGSYGIQVYSPTTNVSLNRNIVKSHGTTLIDGGTGTVSAGNEFDLSGYQDSSRTIAGYSSFVGGAGTLADFYAQARLQSKANWRKEYTAQYANDYIRGGFGRRKMMTIRM